MDQIEKALRKLPKKELQSILAIIDKIEQGNLTNLDIKKLSGYGNIYRVRKGSLRIIFEKMPDGKFNLIAVERRSNKTYNIKSL